MKQLFLLLVFTNILSNPLSAQSFNRNYGGNDVHETVQGAYSLMSQRNGVSIYAAWVTNGRKVYAVCFKVVNNNRMPVIVTWESVKWEYAGTSFNGAGSSYSDKFNPDETKDGIYHKPGSNGAEVYAFRPNWLYFKSPDLNWDANQTSIQLVGIKVLDSNGNPLTH